jgi:hypothetical protein
MSADSVPSSKTNSFQSKLYTLIYCHHFRTYLRSAMFDWSDTVFRRRNVTRRRISNTVLQPMYWGREADSPEVCRLAFLCQVLHNGTCYYGECMFLEFPRGGESLSLLLTATLLWDIIYIIKGVHLCVDPQAVPFQML